MPRKKERLNVTVDPDIARSARRAFRLLDMNMSGFVEQNLAMFLQVIEPFEPVMDEIERGTADPATLKAAMRAFQSSASGLIGSQLVEFGKVSQQINELAGEVSTDKK